MATRRCAICRANVEHSPTHEFLQAQIDEIQRTNPNFFNQPNWPEVLAFRYAKQLTALRSASPLAAATPTSTPRLAPEASARAVEESKARINALLPDVTKPGSFLYVRAIQIKALWQRTNAVYLSEPDWPEQLVSAALQNLLENPPYSVATVTQEWIVEAEKQRLPESEYGHGKRNAIVDDQVAAIRNGRWNDDASGQADRLNATLFRHYGLNEQANRFDARAAGAEAECKARDECLAQQQADADAWAQYQEEQRRNTAALQVQLFQLQSQISASNARAAVKSW